MSTYSRMSKRPMKNHWSVLSTSPTKSRHRASTTRTPPAAGRPNAAADAMTAVAAAGATTAATTAVPAVGRAAVPWDAPAWVGPNR